MTGADPLGRQVRRHNRRVVIFAASVPVGIIFAVLINAFADGGHPANLIGWLSFQSNLFGIVALIVTCTIAARSRRPLTVVDGMRIICWWAFATGLGVSCDAYGYVQCYWEKSYLDVATACGRALSVGSLVAIVLLTILCRARPIPNVGCCSHCGYPREGLKEPRCPECGASFKLVPDHN